ncbi:MAG: response regulator [Chloroflexi bacterium]|nr:response regulator [Chloroflexota bacterium]
MTSQHELLKGMTVLVIDNDQKSLRAAQLVLQRLGASVIASRDGANGLTKALDARPDIIFTELDLPLIDGWRLREELQLDVDLRLVPMIAFTTNANTFERNKVREVGFVDYIEKPFTPSQITRAINGIVAAR